MITVNKIYAEDCLDTMAKMPDSFIDMTVTSPPYNKLRTYQGHDWSFEIFKQIARELFRVTKQGGVVVWVVGDSTVDGCESLTSFRQVLFFDTIGFRLHDTMIYQKNNAIPQNHNRYEPKFEYMFVFSKGIPKTFNPILERKLYIQNRTTTTRKKDGSYKKARSGDKLTKIKGNVWNYNVGGGHVTEDKIAYKHPAIFPEQLAHDHIISWSNEGDLIYDPFGGSGTVAKMCVLLKRNWIISEISSEYCKIASKRILPYLIIKKFKRRGYENMG